MRVAQEKRLLYKPFVHALEIHHMEMFVIYTVSLKSYPNSLSGRAVVLFHLTICAVKRRAAHRGSGHWRSMLAVREMERMMPICAKSMIREEPP